MPALPPDSSDSPPHSVTPSDNDSDAALALPRPSVRPFAWRANAWLFVATVASMFVTWCYPHAPSRVALAEASEFTGSLLAILLAHEFGHYIAARIHKVDASLPYFIPLPILSPFGTMGAVIRMRSIIPTRRALLDIGAAGPLAGLAVAIPAYAWGVAHSTAVDANAVEGGMRLGDSLLSLLLDHWFGPVVPSGMELKVSPMAYAGWTGMFVTMINLLPVGQLDGGHVAYALFGPKQDRIAQWVHRSMLVFFFVSVANFVARDFRAGISLWHFGRHVNDSLFWLVWFEVLAVLGSIARPLRSPRDTAPQLSIRTRAFATLGLAILAGLLRDNASALAWGAWSVGITVLIVMEARWGALRRSSSVLDHPPTDARPLRLGRAVISVVTLLFFVLLFMPTPISL